MWGQGKEGARGKEQILRDGGEAGKGRGRGTARERGGGSRRIRGSRHVCLHLECEAGVKRDLQRVKRDLESVERDLQRVK